MKVLVTGATGLLGSHVVHELVKRKYQVRVFVRPVSNVSVVEGLGVEIFVGQLTDQEDLKKAVEGCNYVIHAAAMAIHKPTRLEAFENVNIKSTRFITLACELAGVRRLVYISTANCFENGSKQNPGDETGGFPGWLKKSGYAYSKFLAQQHVLKETKDGKVDVVVVNPTFIIGKDSKFNGGRIFSFIRNKRIAFYPVGGKNFVDAEAAAVGVVNALEKGKRGECYLLAGENLTYRQFFKIVVHYTGQHTVMIPVPCFFLKLAGRIGDFSERILGRPVQLTYVNARMLCLGNYYTADKAVKDLALPIVPVRDSVEATLKWFEKKRFERVQKFI